MKEQELPEEVYEEAQEIIQYHQDVMRGREEEFTEELELYDEITTRLGGTKSHHRKMLEALIYLVRENYYEDLKQAIDSLEFEKSIGGGKADAVDFEQKIVIEAGTIGFTDLKSKFRERVYDYIVHNDEHYIFFQFPYINTVRKIEGENFDKSEFKGKYDHGIPSRILHGDDDYDYI